MLIKSPDAKALGFFLLTKTKLTKKLYFLIFDEY